MDIVIATKNTGKIREIMEALDLDGLRLLTFEDFTDWPDAEETGDTLEDNALIKARALREATGSPSLADDSGLLVDALGGRPGVHSSRYAGPEGDAERNMDRLLYELRGVPGTERTARFACVIALVLPDGSEYLAHGECPGVILEARKGTGGFGYDPVFLPKGCNRSMAELSLEEKNSISHRGKALHSMKQILTTLQK